MSTFCSIRWVAKLWRQGVHRHALVDLGFTCRGMHGAVELAGTHRVDWILAGKQPATLQQLALGMANPPPAT
jgi:hypothetical protein